MSNLQEKRLYIVQRHIHNVQENCQILADKLLENGEDDLARLLLANAQIHDNSKLKGIEWKYLHDDVKADKPELFQAALESHWSNNEHHPEFWYGSIQSMPEVYLCEMVADWKSRSSEFGLDLREWVKNKASKKYKFTLQSVVYKKIKRYIDMLLEKEFN